jgi:2-methylcitrate dehydratase PrpD
VTTLINRLQHFGATAESRVPKSTTLGDLVSEIVEEISPATEALSSYIATAIDKPLPEEVVESAKIHVVDTFAAMISGSRLLPGERAIAYFGSQGGTDEACIIGSPHATTASIAALANGMLAHADESDDVHPASGTHAGSSIVPAAFAIGERNRISGTAMLRSVVLGYDVCVRHVYALGFHEMRAKGLALGAHAQSFGAAALSSALLGLTPHQIRHVLSYNATLAFGIGTDTRDSEHIQKALIPGRAAQNGVEAALMVAAGFTGVEDSFIGPFNYFSVYSPDGDHELRSKGLGDEYEILRSAIKPWTSGGPTQAPMSALKIIMTKHDVTADQVERVIVRMPAPDGGVVDNREMPNINVQHLIAIMLIDGTLTYQSSHDYERMADPAALALRARVELIKDPGMVEAVRRWRAEMEIVLKDGRTLFEEVLAVKGSVDNPMDREEESAKATDLIGPVFGSDRTAALLAALWDLDKCADVRELRELVTT